MIRTTFRLSLALSLFALIGCGGADETVTMEDVPSPSEGARVINENPSTQTIDVPATPVDESELAEDEPAVPAEAEGAEPSEPTDDEVAVPAEPEGDEPIEDPED